METFDKIESSAVDLTIQDEQEGPAPVPEPTLLKATWTSQDLSQFHQLLPYPGDASEQPPHSVCCQDADISEMRDQYHGDGIEQTSSF